jgi:hypothetical protein
MFFELVVVVEFLELSENEDRTAEKTARMVVVAETAAL